VSATDTNGNAMSSPATWTFTTAALCPCSLFPASATVDSGDASAVNLGLKITPTVNGFIAGVRFYKASTNTGVHTGTLWSSTGSQLATGTFTNETSSGWQTLTFATPVAVTANTTYVVSYYTPTGHYSFNSGFFNSTYSNPPLTAPAGSNGVYLYGAAGFPTSSYNNTNYWVDTIFTPLGVTSTSPQGA
jgi:hypothetical protein